MSETPGKYETKADENKEINRRLTSIEYRLTHLEASLQLRTNVAPPTKDVPISKDVEHMKNGIDTIINLLKNRQKDLNRLVERFDQQGK